MFCMKSENSIDFIILPMYKGSSEILELIQTMDQISKELGVRDLPQIISKFENEEGLKDISEVIRLSNAVFLPRGRLSTVLPIEKISWIQKNVVKLCNKAAKPVIISSQFLDSMITNPFPTRAEATDIHSAVMDGTDCLCLN
jgi:pyruvate kinase